MKIVGYDYPCMDANLLCDHMPGAGELTPLLDHSLMGGGKVANAIVAAARLGAQTAFIGAVGSDRYGRLCREDLAFHGTDVGRLRQSRGRTVVCFCLTDTRTREKHFIESPRAVATISPEAEDLALVAQADYLLLYQLDETAVCLARHARAHGTQVVVDGDEYDERTRRHMGLIDVFIASEYYHQAQFGADPQARTLRMWAQGGPHTVVVTLGGRGCAGYAGGAFFSVPAPAVQVADTTGAGDVFHGAFAWALGDGMDARGAARFASAVSAIKCTVVGGRTGIPTRACTDAYLETGAIPACDFEERRARYDNMAWE